MALMAGIVLGGAATESFNLYRQSHDSQIFQERARCKAIAEAYVKENNTDFKKDPFAKSGVTVTLDKVDYSPARNSCVAKLEMTYWSPRTIVETDSVQDLLSGATLFSARCTKDCVSVPMFIDPAFDYVMNNASKPTKLETEWLDQQSKMSKDAAESSPSSAVTQWDAQGNPIMSNSPPKSARPSAR
jgi:hypothetical protein